MVASNSAASIGLARYAVQPAASARSRVFLEGMRGGDHDWQILPAPVGTQPPGKRQAVFAARQQHIHQDQTHAFTQLLQPRDGFGRVGREHHCILALQ
jgi:hypothetical protein